MAKGMAMGKGKMPAMAMGKNKSPIAAPNGDGGSPMAYSKGGKVKSKNDHDADDTKGKTKGAVKMDKGKKR